MSHYELYQDECLAVLDKMENERFDLIYLDPPFFTQKEQKLQTRDRTRAFSFRDVWESHNEYSDFLSLRLQQAKRVLKSSGALFFHCDYHASHIVRMLLDDIFGTNNFRSEIIWHYRRWSNARRGLLPAHQTIYFYSKSEDYKFHHIYQEYSPSTNIDQILQKRERDASGRVVYAKDTNGNTMSSEAKKGVPLSDVWDIPYLNPKATERTGYPTQKPVLLLQRIIEICTDEGDWVLDPFCGSGTTLVAANLLNRNAVGIDISAQAIALTKQRLKEPIKTESNLLKRGRESYRQANGHLEEVLQGIDFVPVQRNKGIDAILMEQINQRPILIRVQRETETVREAANLLHKAGQSKQASAMILIATHDQGNMFSYTEEELQPEIIVVETPGLSIEQKLQELRQQHHTENQPFTGKEKTQ
jgi:site-specific DNA-methyltransferase (adenine-specific)